MKRFAYIWEYIVKEEYLDDFKQVYGADGDWVKLFKKAEGYHFSELHQDISNPNRFVSVDYWNSRADRDSFQKQFSEEYKILDKRCEKFTIQEKPIGDFNCFTGRLSS